MIKTKTISLLLLLGAFFACAPAMKSEIKVDPAYKGKVYKSFLVLGFSDDLKQRKSFEYEMAAIMNKWGLKAVPSLSVLGSEHRISSAIITGAAQKAKVQAVLMAYYAGSSEAERPKQRGDSPDYDTIPSFFGGGNFYRGREDYSTQKKIPATGMQHLRPGQPKKDRKRHHQAEACLRHERPHLGIGRYSAGQPQIQRDDPLIAGASDKAGLKIISKKIH